MATSSAKILILDDEPEIREIVCELLEEEFLGIVQCENVTGAFKELEGQSFDLIISDIMMPEMSGLDFLKELRIKKVEIPVVFISGTNDMKMLESALALGAADFIEKPFQQADLLAIVRKQAQIGMLINKKS